MTISPQPYKGTRDFYPEDLQKRNYIFQVWRETMTKMGFVEYETSLLENAEIYIAKSGQELGGSQLYNFKDKGDRLIALRPEQTPSLARIVANRFRELRMPLRWFSVPNCFRYERPQKGRLREHWQLNVDIIGLKAGPADLELLNVLAELFKAFGASKSQYKIMFNHRQVLDSWLEENQLGDFKALIYGVLDDWFKLGLAENQAKLAEYLSFAQVDLITDLTLKQGDSWERYLKIAATQPEVKLILDTFAKIQPDVELDFNPCIIRGIAYYTGLVLEAFDKNPENPRALFGGGRYDNLLDLFGQSSPAVGFGMGDVTIHEFLSNWNLWPDFSALNNRIGLMPASQDDLQTLYLQVIPDLLTQKAPFEIDYDFGRSQNKRWETLKKRGCSEIKKIGFDT